MDDLISKMTLWLIPFGQNGKLLPSATHTILMNATIQTVTLQEVGNRVFNFSLVRKENESTSLFLLRIKMVLHIIGGYIVDAGPGKKIGEFGLYYILLPKSHSMPALRSTTDHRLERHKLSHILEMSRYNPWVTPYQVAHNFLLIILCFNDEGYANLPLILWNNRHESESAFNLRAEVELNKLGWEIVERTSGRTRRQSHWTLARIPDGFCG